MVIVFDNLVVAILAIAQEYPDGFTVELPDLKPVTKGWAIAYPETQDGFGPEGCRAAVMHAMSHGRIVGGWKDEETGKFYFDSVRIMDDETQAFGFMVEGDQIEMYEIHTGRYVRRGKHGGH